MLTANDIRNFAFTKGIRGGYKAAEVEVFLEKCADTVAALTSAKVDLEKKMEVLADKLVEYRNDEDNIRTALLSAQRLGDTVVREANHKAGLILEDAKIKAEKMQETARRNIQEEERELERIRKEVTNFKARLLSIYKEHLTLIDALPELEEKKEEGAETAPAETAENMAAETPPQETAPVFEPVEEPAAQEQTAAAEPANTANAVNVVMDLPVLEDDDTMEMEAVNPAAVRAEKAAKEPAAVSRFSDLKFGADYDISKDDEEPTGFFKRRK